MAKVEIQPNGCWLWTGTKNSKGYGRFLVNGRRTGPGEWSYTRIGAHRWAYEHFRGPIPEGMVLDHLCHDRRCDAGGPCIHRACVNPDHLDVVTPALNVHRGRSGLAPRQPKTHCKHGHEMTPENVYIRPSDGRRRCRICQREHRRAFEQTARGRQVRQGIEARRRARNRRS